ncbi:MAG: hypothetical protein NVSMB23_17480 [Myxococcales bacterium]
MAESFAKTTAGDCCLRYRFDDPRQIAAHFRTVEGRAVFFYPVPLAGMENRQVLLDVSFASTGQSCILRGRVLGAEQGWFRGTWLEFATPNTVANLFAAATAPRRQSPRFATDRMASARKESGESFLCRIVDFSETGTRLSGTTALVPGSQLILADTAPSAALGLRTGRARVAWARAGSAGIVFAREAPAARASIERFIEGLQRSWQAAPVAQHPPLCGCASGAPPREPHVPRAAYRRNLELGGLLG